MAISIVQDFFEAHDFTVDNIIEYVEWAYEPAENRFNFIYADAMAAPVSYLSVP